MSCKTDEALPFRKWFSSFVLWTLSKNRSFLFNEWKAFFSFFLKILTRDSKGLSEDQMKEFRNAFNHFDKVFVIWSNYTVKNSQLLIIEVIDQLGALCVVWHELPCWILGCQFSCVFLFFFLQDRSMRLEPLEFQQCLYSLGYDVKEKDKASMAANVGRRGRPCYDGCDGNKYSCLFDFVKFLRSSIRALNLVKC